MPLPYNNNWLARDRIRELEDREREQLDQIKTLCAVITELTPETQASNLGAADRGR
ncbi:hypothetical protein AB0M45_27570 [Nocardia sp. NPDC051787]|uniref:hypothetical protein n=1 Tax=Nocardia sp. NPDC051787 TaxID=3155415 RepID=UPI00341B56B5